MTINLKPGFTEIEAATISETLFGVDGKASQLNGERDQNFLIEAGNDRKYVLKIANRNEEAVLIDAQAELMMILADEGCKSQVVVRGLNGETISRAISKGGEQYLVWMVTYLEGIPMGSLKHHPDELLQDIGFEAGRFDAVMTKRDNPNFHRSFNWDLCRFPESVEEHLSLISNPVLNKFVSDTISLYSMIIVPRENQLRKSIIHNDINDYNIIVESGGDFNFSTRLSGIIDFGDTTFSYTIANLAVAIAYAMLDKPDPLSVAVEVVRGYNRAFNILSVEAEALHTLVRMRLSVSICMAAYQQSLRPDDEYLSISQEPILRSIGLIEAVSPDLAEVRYRLAAGVPPGAGHSEIIEYLGKTGPGSSPILGKKLTRDNSVVLDLSVHGALTSGDPNLNSEQFLSERISGELESFGVEVGIGRYNEPRTLYTSPIFNGKSFTEREERTIHLGIDLFDKAGSPLFSPYDAVIHAFSYNPDPLDYGNVIILRHTTGKGSSFYTLYGHLSNESLSGKVVGGTIKAGEMFATTGNPSENGGWTPHVHFQLISDLQVVDSDFPGVCTPCEREAWMILSPDPNLILDIPSSMFPESEVSLSETYTKRLELTGKNLSIGYRKHIKMARGWMQYMYDSDGIKYLDGYNNVPHVGHSHPEVIEAAHAQMRKLNTNTRYLYDSINEYASLLLSTFPGELNRCYFLNSASEANELALRLAFTYTGNRSVIVLEGAYHGNTNTLINISPYKHDGPGGSGAPSWVYKAPIADCFRGEFGYDDPSAGVKYGSKVGEIAESILNKEGGVAAFIAETCPSVGGQIIFPEGYLREVYRHTRGAGGLCIADEVQTGYGRVGTSFYAFTDQGVVPDIVVLGKPIGNGHPIGAVITKAEIAETFDNGMEFFSTFGGNTVSSVTGRKVLEITLRDKLQEHSMRVGSYLLDRVKSMKRSYPIIGDVRGSGLFIGVELVKSLETLEPATEEAAWVCNRMRENRILIGTDGPFHNVLKIRPPMPFTLEDADIMADRLERILKI